MLHLIFVCLFNKSLLERERQRLQGKTEGLDAREKRFALILAADSCSIQRADPPPTMRHEGGPAPQAGGDQ